MTINESTAANRVHNDHKRSRQHLQTGNRPVWLGEDKRQWDHVRVHVQVIYDERLGANELAVYLGLVNHAELDGGRSRPSITTLAKYAQISESSVRRSIRKLATLNYIEIDPRPGKTSYYFVLSPPELSTPLSQTTGVTGTPLSQGPDTPVTVTDEQEQLNHREINNKEFLVSVDNSPTSAPCTKCAGGWLVDSEGRELEPIKRCDCGYRLPKAGRSLPPEQSWEVLKTKNKGQSGQSNQSHRSNYPGGY